MSHCFISKLKKDILLFIKRQFLVFAALKNHAPDDLTGAELINLAKDLHVEV